MKWGSGEPRVFDQERSTGDEWVAGVFAIDPLQDPRWNRFVAEHPGSSAYQSVEWLAALRHTYNYEPIAFTTSPPGEPLRNAIVFCNVETWLTKRRLISLPFSDHCAPMFDDPVESSKIFFALDALRRQGRFGYIELRPVAALDTNVIGPRTVYGYCGHQLNLEPNIDVLFRSLHRDSTQRKIRRAEREGLIYEAGRSPHLLNSFYSLLISTRRRHGVPPQPRRWFQSLIDTIGSNMEIRVAFKNDRPIAAILTLRHKNILLFKYGASDVEFHNLGGVHLLFWESICRAKQDGMRMFDFGRSAWSNKGLITFKDRWGAERIPLNYVRLASSGRGAVAHPSPGSDWKERTAKMIFSHMPGRALRIAGELIYPHIG